MTPDPIEALVEAFREKFGDNFIALPFPPIMIKEILLRSTYDELQYKGQFINPRDFETFIRLHAAQLIKVGQERAVKSIIEHCVFKDERYFIVYQGDLEAARNLSQ